MTSPQRYELQFSTVEEHVQLIEKAKAPLAPRKPRQRGAAAAEGAAAVTEGTATVAEGSESPRRSGASERSGSETSGHGLVDEKHYVRIVQCPEMTPAQDRGNKPSA